ncbi:MAG: hypothetical protein WA941_06620 [Nitrososphaeraceae archaeon]
MVADQLHINKIRRLLESTKNCEMEGSSRITIRSTTDATISTSTTFPKLNTITAKRASSSK